MPSLSEEVAKLFNKEVDINTAVAKNPHRHLFPLTASLPVSLAVASASASMEKEKEKVKVRERERERDGGGEKKKIWVGQQNYKAMPRSVQLNPAYKRSATVANVTHQLNQLHMQQQQSQPPQM
jgi:hypothetical protein